jgi:sugar lactone lactonase YvrE
MTMSEILHLLSVQNKLGESPIWEPREKALYWVDWGGNPIHRYDPATGKVETFAVDRPVTALARRAAGGWVAVSRTSLDTWDPKTNLFSPIVGQPEPENPQVCYSDSVVDSQGRLLVGTFNWPDVQEPDGSLYRLDPDGSLHQLDTGFATSNGLGLSPDGRILYFTDMQHHQILAYDYDVASGVISNRRVFAHVDPEDGLPDGLVVDSEGFVWSGHWEGWRLRRYDPDGVVEREYKFPMELVICPGFGGEEMDDLYVTTSCWDFDEAKLQEQPLAGDLFLIKPGVKGQVESAFAG